MSQNLLNWNLPYNIILFDIDISLFCNDWEIVSLYCQKLTCSLGHTIPKLLALRSFYRKVSISTCPIRN